jgi:Na+/H+-dicarboxylate symporter
MPWQTEHRVLKIFAASVLSAAVMVTGAAGLSDFSAAGLLGALWLGWPAVSGFEAAAGALLCLLPHPTRSTRRDATKTPDRMVLRCFILTSIIGTLLRNRLHKERDGSAVLLSSNKEPRRLFASSADRVPGRAGVETSDAGQAEDGG